MPEPPPWRPPLYPYPLAQRLFEEQQDKWKKERDAVDAITFMEATGVVMTNRFFWHKDSGESLVDAVKRAQREECEQYMKERLRGGER